MSHASCVNYFFCVFCLYRDVIADVNIFQGAIFHDDNAEDFDVVDAVESDQLDTQKRNEETVGKSRRKNQKPAAHRVSIIILLLRHF